MLDEGLFCIVIFEVLYKFAEAFLAVLVFDVDLDPANCLNTANALHLKENFLFDLSANRIHVLSSGWLCATEVVA